MHNTSLAIVMPAYKQTFLEKALESIASQTIKDFTVYIGDDASPYDLYSVIKNFEPKLNIVYKKFADNIGGKDLVKQWERCIELIGDEQWIWLFSDDDMMDANCVESFCKAVKAHPECDLFHFDVDIIDENDRLLYASSTYPEQMSITDFHKGRIKSTLRSYVVEYIFKRKTFEDVGGFEHFDLAWSSDDATWTKIGRQHGIVTVPNAKVKWRYSNENITPKVKDADIAQRKLLSLLCYTSWQVNFFRQYNVMDDTSAPEKLLWFVRNVKNFHPLFSKRQRMEIVAAYLKIINAKYLLPIAYVYFFVTDFKRHKFLPVV